MAKGFHVFYLKVGLDIEAELQMVRTIREATGPRAKIRLDANCAWKVNEAIRNPAVLDACRIDFVEQPVGPDPLANMREVRSRSPVALCLNKGPWTAAEAYRQITARTADVFCFSPYWVGSLAQFQRLSFVAHFEGLQVCRHTHGEFGITAAAGMSKDRVRVNAICPGFVATEPQLEWLQKPESQAMMESLHLLPIATPEQIAPFVV